jgi:cytochrome c-type biogenesis protein CcmF
MIPEFGHFLLWLALGLSLILGVVPLAGAQLQRPGWMALARPGAVWVLLLVAAATFIVGARRSEVA